MGKKRRMYPHLLNLQIFAKRTPQKVLKGSNPFFERRARFRNKIQIRFQQSRYPDPMDWRKMETPEQQRLCDLVVDLAFSFYFSTCFRDSLDDLVYQPKTPTG